jgi:hypothetical protein
MCPARKATISFATSAKGGLPSTSASVIPCTAVVTGGMGRPGWMSQLLRSTTSPWRPRTMPTSMRRSAVASRPVVSVSMKAMG